jgi:hypothetical protein
MKKLRIFSYMSSEYQAFIGYLNYSDLKNRI